MKRAGKITAICAGVLLLPLLQACGSPEDEEIPPDPQASMVLLPAKSKFVVGSRDYQPQRTVAIKSFYISRWETTQMQYEEVMGENPSTDEGPQLPVHDVSWIDAARFCNKLSQQRGLDPCYNESDYSCDMSKNGFRLPTSAEWEYACRGDSTAVYFWGNDKDESYCVASGSIKPVGSVEPNPRELYDMAGNVSEWCQDETDDEIWRIYRGGSCKDAGWKTFECKWYGRGRQDEGWSAVGFRFVRSAHDDMDEDDDQ